MRTTWVISAAVLAVLAGCSKPKTDANAPAAADAGAAVSTGGSASQTNILEHMPARKEGLWIQTMSHNGAATSLGEMRMCLDAAADQKFGMLGRGMTNTMCQTAVSRGLDGAYAYSASCKMGAAGTVTSKGTITGDFSSAYKVHSESDVDMSGAGRPPRHSVTDVEARYAGPCPAGMVAGDMEMGHGIKFNINKMPNLGQAMGGG